MAAGLIVLMVLSSTMFQCEHSGDLITADFSGLVLLAILHSFLPGKMWTLAHCIDLLHYKEISEPSDTGLVLQQVANLFLTLLGGAVFTFHLLVLCNVL